MQSSERDGRVWAGSGASSEMQHHSFLSSVETTVPWGWSTGSTGKLLKDYVGTQWFEGIHFQARISVYSVFISTTGREGSRAKVILMDLCPFTKILLTFSSGVSSGVEESGCQTKGKFKDLVIG